MSVRDRQLEVVRKVVRDQLRGLESGSHKIGKTIHRDGSYGEEASGFKDFEFYGTVEIVPEDKGHYVLRDLVVIDFEEKRKQIDPNIPDEVARRIPQLFSRYGIDLEETVRERHVRVYNLRRPKASDFAGYPCVEKGFVSIDTETFDAHINLGTLNENTFEALQNLRKIAVQINTYQKHRDSTSLKIEDGELGFQSLLGVNVPKSAELGQARFKYLADVVADIVSLVLDGRRSNGYLGQTGYEKRGEPLSERTARAAEGSDLLRRQLEEAKKEVKRRAEEE